MNVVPQKKVMTFNRHMGDFEFHASYTELEFLNEEEKSMLGSVNLTSVSVKGVAAALEKHTPKGESKGIKAFFRMDENGILNLEKVESVFEKPDEKPEEEQSTFAKIGSKISSFFGSSKEDENKDSKVEEGDKSEEQESDKMDKEKSEQEDPKAKEGEKTEEKPAGKADEEKQQAEGPTVHPKTSVSTLVLLILLGLKADGRGLFLTGGLQGLIFQAPFLYHLLHLFLSMPHHEADDKGRHDPVQDVGDNLDRCCLILPTEESPHQDEEAIRLIVAAHGGIPNIYVLPGPLGSWTPCAENIQLLELVHGCREEAGRDTHEQYSRNPHEPVHFQTLCSLEETAPDKPCQDQGADDRQGQGTEILNVGDDAHEEHDGL